MSWSISHTPAAGGSVVTKSPEAWGVTIESLSLANATTDLAKLSAPFSSSPGWGYLDEIVISLDNEIWFSGVIPETPYAGDASRETVSFEVVGPWWWLTNIVFQQNWGEFDTTSETIVSRKRSRVLLGMDDDGGLLTTGAQIDGILAYAATAGAPFQVGSVFPDGSQRTWTTERVGQTCGDIIRDLMQWHRDRCIVVDYSTTPPTVNVGVAPSTVSIDVSSDRVTSLQHRPRNDVKPPAVVFVYEQDHQADSSTYQKTTRDVWPTSATGSEPGAIVSTIPLQGSQRQTQSVRIRAKRIPTAKTSDLDSSVETFWRENLPWLGQFSTADIKVGGHTRELARLVAPPEALSPANVVADSTDVSDYPRQLLDGQIEDWMNKRAERVMVTAVIAYAGPGTDAAREIFTDLIEVVKDSGKFFPAIKVSIEIMGTDAQTGKYVKTIQATQAEDPPTGLAQSYYESLSELRHEGTLTLTDSEVDRTSLIVGNKLAITDGSGSLVPASLIQKIDQDPENGETIISFGPPSHLTPQDFIESLRLQRTLPKQTFTTAERTQAEPNETQSIAGHGLPKSNTTTDPPPSRRKHAFATDIIAGNKIVLTPGWFFENGDGQGTECIPQTGVERTITGTLHLYVVADTDKVGAVTDLTTDWRVSHPTGLKQHREEKTDNETDGGDVGKYAWHVLTASLSGGKVVVDHHITGAIYYYSDRSKKNWLSSFPQPVFESRVPQIFSEIYLPPNLRFSLSNDCYSVIPTDNHPIKHREKTLSRDDADIYSASEINPNEPVQIIQPSDSLAELQKCMHPGGGANDRIWVYDSNGDRASQPIENFTSQIQTELDTHTAKRHLTDAEISKLEGVETGAEVNPSAGELKSSYESNSNTNAFTDAEKSKLASVDATAYGSPVLNESALASISSPPDKQRRYVEAETADYFFNSSAGSGDVSPSDGTSGYWIKVAIGGESASSLKIKYESNADTNAFTNSEQTKLAALSETHQASTSNPHNVSASQLGLGNVDDVSDENKPISIATLSALAGKAATNHTHAASEISDSTTVGRSLLTAGNLTSVRAIINVEDGAQANPSAAGIKSSYEGNANTNAFTDAEQTKLSELDLNHQASTSNPHNVSASQLGLGNVDNTADLDKPVSSAMEIELEGKASIGHVHAVADLSDISATGVNVITTDAPGIRTILNVADNAEPNRTSNEVVSAYDSVIPEVSASELAAATVTSTRRVSPAAIKDFIDTHASAGDLSASDINTLPKLNSKITGATLIDTTDSRLTDSRTPSAHTHSIDDVSDITSNGKSILETTYAGMRALLNVEDGAQVNPSAAGIKSSYEGNVNTNAFTDAEKSKLASAGDLSASDINTLPKLNSKITGATLIDTTDSRLTDSRTPSAHTHQSSEITDATTTGRNLLTATNVTSVKQLLLLDQVGNVAIPTPPSGAGPFTLRATSGNIAWQSP